jgi:hypothetical protein
MNVSPHDRPTCSPGPKVVRIAGASSASRFSREGYPLSKQPERGFRRVGTVGRKGFPQAVREPHLLSQSGRAGSDQRLSFSKRPRDVPQLTATNTRKLVTGGKEQETVRPLIMMAKRTTKFLQTQSIYCCRRLFLVASQLYHHNDSSMSPPGTTLHCLAPNCCTRSKAIE